MAYLDTLFFTCPRCSGFSRLACPLCGGRGEVPWFVLYEEGELNEWDLAYEVAKGTLFLEEIQERYGQTLTEEVADKAAWLNEEMKRISKKSFSTTVS